VKNIALGAFIFVAATAANVAADPYEVIVKRAVVRQMPTASGAGMAVALKGQVVDGVSVKNWVLVELANGAKGYIFGKALKAAQNGTPVVSIQPGFAQVAGKAGIAKQVGKERGVVAQPPLDLGGIPTKEEAAVSKMRVIKIKGLMPGEADNVKALTAQITSLEEENARLKKVEDKTSLELRALQNALASVDSRLQSTLSDKRRLEQESRALTDQLAAAEGKLKQVYAGGRGKLLALADSGEAVYFTGVGEAQIASLDGRSALRFPVSIAKKADKVFMPVKAERYLHGAFVYYVLDSSALSF